ncbi:ABC transporter substrate-binding protein [Leisingera thetidis]|uniref:ABC transporter substrate-binding protein n=1 Tax=Leisingera thetidis TaxID=2930199 RepID=UPI0021F70870|nr:ABC transporter substrate-binding protein [Leisingera thetidis]
MFKLMTQRVMRKGILCGILMGSTALAAMPPAYAGSAEPIKIVENNWTSQLVLSRITGALLEKAGYSVEYKPADNQLQFVAIGNGDMHVQVEVWEGTHRTSFQRQLDAGRMVDAGSHDAVTREDWWYPAYMEKTCPGLPDYEALNKCAEAFATPETAPKGRYLGGPIDWEKPDPERIEALGLDFDVVNAGQASTLWAELDAAYRREEPIVLFNWTPNWVEARYDGKFIEFPEHDAKCETDPAWGSNPELTHDCGNPRAGWLKKGVWSGMEDEWPGAYEIIQNLNFTNEHIAQAAAMVDVDGLKPEEAAEQWIRENENVWSAWLN